MTKKNVILKGRFIRNDLSFLQVLSVHEGIINLLNKKTGYIISLIENKKNMTGMSLLVPDLFQAGVKTVLKPVSKRGQIKFGNVIIIYQNAEIWPDTPIPQKWNIHSRLIEMDILKRELETGDSFLALLTNRCNNTFQKKAREILDDQVGIENDKLIGLEQLVGLGQGLTPSGDDFITGILLGEVCLNGSIHISKKAIESKLENTTYAGKTLLFLALKGSFPAYLMTYIKEVSQSTGENDLLTAAEKAAGHGSTSGLDSLAGFYWYYNFIDNYSV